MELFLQTAGLALIAVILLRLLRQSHETAVVLSIAACGLILLAAAGLLSPVLDFLDEICQIGGLNREFLPILLKCAGIGFLGEIAMLICSDAGESAIAKAVQITANGAILLLSLPLLRQLLQILKEVLGQI